LISFASQTTAVARGSGIETGGRRDRAVVQPTVLSNTQPHMEVEAEEIFSPVMTVGVYDEFEEAIAQCNNSKYGLQGGFFTQNLKNAFRAIEDWEVGGLMINDVPIYRIDNMPFGGWKELGFGLESTRYAMGDMTDIRQLVINYA
jgi:glyceraldehyde-3-phosphate dehydrogenase (NADP+)